ncbi:helix-turn-helix domain-containing protein [Variovorax sp. JS1663]|uniref:helix-turn-helix domain-containing protein n=1 Tax=Variovorax sp. JS1663 TaxID=1851577 RepID=UPI000B3498C6|nr:helix-turn-helix domain-containing protein [Variovorax sp. JS1663]OUM01649.1 hypothetical protein A8M77_15360 [Variovorax sp. JS1663]
MSEALDARAHKIQTSILQAVQRNSTQAAIAASMGISESTLSRFLNDHAERFAAVLAHAGLRVVGENMRCLPTDYVDALLLMAKQHLSTVQTVRHLEWD